MIKKEYIFPVILIALDVGVGIIYGAAGKKCQQKLTPLAYTRKY